MSQQSSPCRTHHPTGNPVWAAAEWVMGSWDGQGTERMVAGNEGGAGSARSLRMKRRGSGLHKGSISESRKWGHFNVGSPRRPGYMLYLEHGTEQGEVSQGREGSRRSTCTGWSSPWAARAQPHWGESGIQCQAAVWRARRPGPLCPTVGGRWGAACYAWHGGHQ